MPFQQRTNTSCYLAIPTHGFTVVLSVFGGTPPAKPLNCKSFQIVSARVLARDGQNPPVESLGLPARPPQQSYRARFSYPHTCRGLISPAHRYYGGWTPQFVLCSRTSSRRRFV